MVKYTDIAGKTFNKLTAIEPIKVPSSKGGICTWWIFQCQCGGRIQQPPSRVAWGQVKSCGCSKYKGHYKGLESLIQQIFKYYSDGNLTIDQFKNFSSKNCYYCGSLPSNCRSRKNRDGKVLYSFSYNGLDRLDSSKPHHFDNVVPCCRLCNRLKSDLHIDDFLRRIELIYNYRVVDICGVKHAWF